MMQSALDRLVNFGGAATRQFCGIPLFHRRNWLLLMVLAALVPVGANAQLGGTGTIEGTIADPTGALVFGATVNAHNVATGTEMIRTTTRSGLFLLAPLDAGTYTVTVTTPGFAKLVRENIHLDGLQVLSLNLTLSVGTANQTVTVTAAPQPLETGMRPWAL